MDSFLFDEIVANIKSSVSMQDVCDMEGIKVNGAGFVLCPFHNDRRPSMKVYPRDKGYHCFVCGAHGDVISFVGNYEGLDFWETIKRLCVYAGIPYESHADEKRLAEAKLKAKQRRDEADEHKRQLDQAEADYDFWMSVWIDLDKAERNYPVGSKQYAYAVKNKDYVAYRASIAETRLYDMKHKER